MGRAVEEIALRFVFEFVYSLAPCENNSIGEQLMKLILLVSSCVALTLVAVACTETATPTTPATPRTAAASPAPSTAASPSADEFAHAREIYAKNCDACHGPKAEGGLAKVDNKQIKVPSLKAEHAIKHSDEVLTKTITNGEEAMPAFKNKLTADEITLMVRYIRKVVQAKS
jgi:mono/diheme cytochrome c family protein